MRRGGSPPVGSAEDNSVNVTDPWVFFGVSGAVVAYLLYMMIRRRRGIRPGVADREPEL
jgi:surfactin synthase thioesterase subunit